MSGSGRLYSGRQECFIIWKSIKQCSVINGKLDTNIYLCSFQKSHTNIPCIYKSHLGIVNVNPVETTLDESCQWHFGSTKQWRGKGI